MSSTWRSKGKRRSIKDKVHKSEMQLSNYIVDSSNFTQINKPQICKPIKRATTNIDISPSVNMQMFSKDDQSKSKATGIIQNTKFDSSNFTSEGVKMRNDLRKPADFKSKQEAIQFMAKRKLLTHKLNIPKHFFEKQSKKEFKSILNPVLANDKNRDISKENFKSNHKSFEGRKEVIFADNGQNKVKRSNSDRKNHLKLHELSPFKNEESKQDACNEQGKSAIKYLQKNNRHRTMIFRSPIKKSQINASNNLSDSEEEESKERENSI